MRKGCLQCLRLAFDHLSCIFWVQNLFMCWLWHEKSICIQVFRLLLFWWFLNDANYRSLLCWKWFYDDREYFAELWFKLSHFKGKIFLLEIDIDWFFKLWFCSLKLKYLVFRMFQSFTMLILSLRWSFKCFAVEECMSSTKSPAGLCAFSLNDEIKGFEFFKSPFQLIGVPTFLYSVSWLHYECFWEPICWKCHCSQFYIWYFIPFDPIGQMNLWG